MVDVPANFRSSDEWFNDNAVFSVELLEKIHLICREEAEADVMIKKNGSPRYLDAFACGKDRGYSHDTLAWDFYYNHHALYATFGV